MRECFILAGGESRRFGEDKLTYKIKGKRCIDYVIDALRPVCERVAVAGKDPSKFESVEFLLDTLHMQGALVGIHTALKNTKGDKALIVSGDMPLIKSSLVLHLYESYEPPITIYQVKDKLYPLFGIYSKGITEELEKYLREGNLKVMDFLKRVGYHTIRETQIMHLDPELVSFINMNTKRELEYILKHMSEKTLKIQGMTCQHCVNTVKRALMSLEGVSYVDVSLEKGEAKVVLEKDIPFETLKSAVEEFGYKVVGEV